MWRWVETKKRISKLNNKTKEEKNTIVQRYTRTELKKDRKTGTKKDRKTGTKTKTGTTDTNTDTDRQLNRPTHRDRDRQVNRQTLQRDRLILKQSEGTYRGTDRHTDKTKRTRRTADTQTIRIRIYL